MTPQDREHLEHLASGEEDRIDWHSFLEHVQMLSRVMLELHVRTYPTVVTLIDDED